jgi:hypothetical protein
MVRKVLKKNAMPKRKKPKVPEAPEQYFSTDGKPEDPKVLVYEIFPKAQKTIYHFRDVRYIALTDKLTIEGYTANERPRCTGIPCKIKHHSGRDYREGKSISGDVNTQDSILGT